MKRSNSGRLSKQNRKRLRKEVEASIRNEDDIIHVISNTATVNSINPDKIITEARELMVNLQYNVIDAHTYCFTPPDAPDDLSCVLGYGKFDDELLLRAQSYNIYEGITLSNYYRKPMISCRAKVQLHQINLFLQVTLTRVLGRLCRGLFIREADGYVCDEWQTWSLDYLDQNMFKVHLLYTEDGFDCNEILREFPKLKTM